MTQQQGQNSENKKGDASTTTGSAGRGNNQPQIKVGRYGDRDDPFAPLNPQNMADPNWRPGLEYRPRIC